MAKELTFEDVDKHIQKADLSALEKTTPGGAGDVAGVTTQICAAYKVIRPILALIAAAIFLPSKWRKAVKAFMKVMDTICP